MWGVSKHFFWKIYKIGLNKVQGKNLKTYSWTGGTSVKKEEITALVSDGYGLKGSNPNCIRPILRYNLP